jgi:hypothetical protein
VPTSSDAADISRAADLLDVGDWVREAEFVQRNSAPVSPRTEALAAANAALIAELRDVTERRKQWLRLDDPLVDEAVKKLVIRQGDEFDLADLEWECRVDFMTAFDPAAEVAGKVIELYSNDFTEEMHRPAWADTPEARLVRLALIEESLEELERRGFVGFHSDREAATERLAKERAWVARETGKVYDAFAAHSRNMETDDITEITYLWLDELNQLDELDTAKGIERKSVRFRLRGRHEEADRLASLADKRRRHAGYRQDAISRRREMFWPTPEVSIGTAGVPGHRLETRARQSHGRPVRRSGSRRCSTGPPGDDEPPGEPEPARRRGHIGENHIGRPPRALHNFGVEAVAS